ncbi:MAG: ABC transporter substrate-binding protein, partial [Burkholderiaceae bacterium]|nr:ABC transporter substrate-binding protein [Burkholderiaceae bacterium]
MNILSHTLSCARQLLAASLIALPLFAHAGGKSIVIGQAVDLSSQNGSIGRDYVAGIKTYFDSLNAAGGINGRKVEYIVRDDQGQPDLAVAATTELIERDKADFLIGGVGDDTTQAVLNSAAFKHSGQVLYAPLTGAEQGKETHVLYWRPSYMQEMKYIFGYFTKLGMKDVGVVVQNNAASQEAFNTLQNEIKAQGMRIAGTVRVAGNGDQIGRDAAKLSQSKPSFVIVVGDTIATGLFLKEFRKTNPQTFVAGTSLTNLGTLVELAGPSGVKWTVFSQVVPNPNSSASPIQAEHQSMMKKYRDEAVSSLTLEGFAAAKALVKTMQQTKRYNYEALGDIVAHNANIDLGGLNMVCSPTNNHLSTYLDIA